MKIIIAGSRGINDIKKIERAVNSSPFNVKIIISGCARGVDTLAIEYANSMDISVIKKPANWFKYKKQAGYIRNLEMADIADGLIAIWDGKSKGTKHMIDTMNKINKPVFIYDF